MLKFTIITVTKNCVKTIEETIKSIISQKYPNFEHIVIDGESTDGTLEILQKYKDNFTYFESSPDKGIYDAMNKGILHAKGDYVGFINGDDIYYKETLKKINNILQSQSNNKIFTVAELDYIDTGGNIIGSKIPRSDNQIIQRKFIEMPSNHLGIFFPLDSFKKFGLFNTKFKFRADYHFVLLLIKHNYKPINVNFKLGAFRLGGKSGGYDTFKENYKVIRSVDGSFLVAVYSTLFSLTKLYFQRNLPRVYKIITKIYYKLNLNLNRKEILTDYKKRVIHIIESDIGGGAEKLLHLLAQNSKVDQKIIFLNKINKNYNNKINYFFLNIKANGIIKIFIASCAIFKFLLKEKDKEKLLIHSHLGKALYSAFIPSILLGISHIHTEHNTFNRRRIKFYLYWIEYAIYNSLKCIICISEPVRFELLSYMPSIQLKNTTVIENGTKLYKHKNRDFNKSKLNLLVLGSLTYKKGIDLLIQILPDLLEKIDHVKIVGSGPEKENLINLTKKLNLENYVKFTPFLKNPSQEIYSSHLGVIPSRWEGFGLVAVEMRSSGLPILISDTPGLYDIYSKYNGVYSFKNGSIQSLKKSLINVIKNLTFEKNEILNLNTSFENFSDQSFKRNYYKFYKNNFNLR